MPSVAMPTMSLDEQHLTRAKMACDECHSRRVKCNGQTPCLGCDEIGIDCTYVRPVHRRGGASEKQRIKYIDRRRKRASDRIASSGLYLSATLNQPTGAYETCPYEPRYPILLPVMASLDGILTASTACDMLDTYFRQCTWGNSFLVRKASILTTRPDKVRVTKPTLIYAMLCYAAQHHNMTRPESINLKQRKTADKLFELASSSLVSFQNLEEEANLDDVMSYIQLASILSASKYQKKSIEWWSAAYQLARQLRLNEEYMADISEEMMEERRRTWWLLYCVDRHQALSVRKSLSFRDAEGDELLHPCDDSVWNCDGEFVPPRSSVSGIAYRITGCSFFGFILPLMSILGEVIDLYNLQEASQSADIESKRATIQHHLDQYDESLREFTCESEDAQLYMCYARHTVSTLHILATGKWDPLDALADVEASGPSQDVIYSAARATIAASTIQEIQQLDVEFGFMPLFFGTFLLQCSFPLLLLMKTFGTQSDENIIGGCEMIMDAHMTFARCRERMAPSASCVSPYWSRFGSIIDEIKASKRGPITSRGVALQTMQDIHSKTREILGLYRWNKTGHGVNT